MVEPLSIAVDAFYLAVFAFAAFWSIRVIRLVGRSEVSQNWWFISTGIVLMFPAGGWILYLDLLGLPQSLTVAALLAPASMFLLTGIYLEHRHWVQQSRKTNDYRGELDEVFEKIISLRRPELRGNDEVKAGLKNFLEGHAVGLSFPAMLAAVDEWNVDGGL